MLHIKPQIPAAFASLIVQQFGDADALVAHGAAQHQLFLDPYQLQHHDRLPQAQCQMHSIETHQFVVATTMNSSYDQKSCL